MSGDVWADRLYRISLGVWIAGTVLIVLSWVGQVTPSVGWVGFGIAGLGFMLSLIARFIPRIVSQRRPGIMRHPLAQLLPDEADIPVEMRLVQQGTLNNHQAAQAAPDLHQRLQLFVAWGRIESVYRRYVSKFECQPQQQLTAITLQAVQYTQPDGAKRALREDSQQSTAQITYQPLEAVSGSLGDEVHLARTMSADACQPPKLLRGVEIRFRRGRFLGIVTMAAVQGTLPDTDLERLTLRLAQSMDKRMSEQDGYAII